MVRRIVCPHDMPIEKDASHWPLATDEIAARMISDDRRQAVEDEEELHQQRRAADDPDVEAHRRRRRGGPEQAHQSRGQPEPEAEHEGQNCQRNRKNKPGPQEGPERIEHQLQPVRHAGLP
jgi:hypothetical protein